QVLGPGLGWWWRTEKTEDAVASKKSLHWRALFGLIGGGNDGVERYFSLVGGRIPLRPKKVWEPRRKRLKAKAKAAQPANQGPAIQGPVTPAQPQPAATATPAPANPAPANPTPAPVEPTP